MKLSNKSRNKILTEAKLNNKLNEADEETINVTDELQDDEDLSFDLTADSEEDIEDELVDAGVEPEVAEDKAEEVAEIAEEAGVTWYQIFGEKIENPNKITRGLDAMLKAARRASNSKGKLHDTTGNVCIEGLPGCGKTAIVRSWAATRHINLVAIDCKEENLKDKINGITLPVDDPDNPGNKMVKKARYRSLYNILSKPYTVVFFDEYNRAEPHLRASLLTLLNEKSIFDDDEPSGYKRFDNILFSVIAINPEDRMSLQADKNIHPLIPAERGRINMYIQFDGDPEGGLSWCEDMLEKGATEVLEKYPNEIITDELDKEDYWALMNGALFCNYILDEFEQNPGIFNYDDRQTAIQKGISILSARSFANGLADLTPSTGELTVATSYSNDLVDWIKEYSGFSEETATKLINLAQNFPAPEVIDPSTGAVQIFPSDSENSSEEDDDLESIEDLDDDSLFNDKDIFGGQASGRPTSVADAKNSIVADALNMGL